MRKKIFISFLGVLALPFYLSAEDLQGGYNKSANYLCQDGLNVEMSADFLYWDWQQDFLQIGTLVDGSFGSSKSLYLDPNYHPGFQIGVGFNLLGMDDWHFFSEYTWYKNRSWALTKATEEEPIVLPSSFSRMDQQLQKQAHLVGVLKTQASMHFNALDILLGRPFYMGRKLTANVFMGLKTLWLSERSLLESFTDTIDLTSGKKLLLYSKWRQKSWALGPKIGVDASWLFGKGLKLLANGSFSTLYTRYTVYANSETVVNLGKKIKGRQEELNNYGTLRPITETFLGIGWESHFLDDSFRIDLAIGYDFNVYWAYNMNYAVTDQKIGSMYLHGLNVHVRLDF